MYMYTHTENIIYRLDMYMATDGGEIGSFKRQRQQAWEATR